MNPADLATWIVTWLIIVVAVGFSGVILAYCVRLAALQWHAYRADQVKLDAEVRAVLERLVQVESSPADWEHRAQLMERLTCQAEQCQRVKAIAEAAEARVRELEAPQRETFHLIAGDGRRVQLENGT